MRLRDIPWVKGKLRVKTGVLIRRQKTDCSQKKKGKIVKCWVKQRQNGKADRNRDSLKGARFKGNIENIEKLQLILRRCERASQCELSIIGGQVVLVSTCFSGVLEVVITVHFRYVQCRTVQTVIVHLGVR